ncbi:hypothetical protein PHMEG_00018884 [Phytophthora megakarya]|uniref:Uncharacterized protein n=1 Tax=Phytophthora megakarya TaxID=4795 RepID=A0A225VSN9_9STRA|nr:hypothetical protein PHMEG_00018884 [Phytophthora megakarya]
MKMGYDSPAPKKPRDFCADNVHQGRSQNRGPTRRQGRAFMTQGEDELAQDSEFQRIKQRRTQSRFQSSPMVELMEKSFESQRTNTGSHPGQGHPEVNYWTVIICERCQAKGHPGRVCTRPPCAECGGFHGGISCEQWKAFQSVMTLAKQGNASELPTQFRSLLQTKDHASGAQQLNQ